MKVKVIKRFVDRNTKEMRREGKTCEYGEERAKELIAGGFVEEVSKGKVAPVQSEKSK